METAGNLFAAFVPQNVESKTLLVPTARAYLRLKRRARRMASNGFVQALIGYGLRKS